ncbi:hypothetical protein CP02DC21_1826, partial [Chlamydia psittaci 02DC21]
MFIEFQVIIDVIVN